ncbi:MAG: GNAT family N-acetyltransferase [bacterium]|nr:GNAT family N-acetyltransferase [bacterium]
MAEARKIHRRDLDAYRRLRVAMLKEAPWAFASLPYVELTSHPSVVRQWLDDPGNELVVIDHPDEDGELASAVGIQRETKAQFRHKAVAWGVYTVPEYRGQGFGEVAMRQAIEVARSWSGVETLLLHVTGVAAEALELYSSIGFETWGVEPDCVRLGGESYDVHRMRLSL